MGGVTKQIFNPGGALGKIINPLGTSGIGKILNPMLNLVGDKKKAAAPAVAPVAPPPELAAPTVADASNALAMEQARKNRGRAASIFAGGGTGAVANSVLGSY